MEQIEAFINSRMTDMSFQPKNNNTLPKQIKQSNFYSTASTTPTDIMDVSKAYCWTYFLIFLYIKLISKKKKKNLFFNWITKIPSIVSTKLVWFFIFTLIVISQKNSYWKKNLYTFICISPPQKNIEKKPLLPYTTPSKYGNSLYSFRIVYNYYYIMCYCTWRRKCC